VAHVHPQDDVRLPAVPAERALADEQPEDDPGVERAESRRSVRMFHENHYGETNSASWCFTVMIPVERRGEVQFTL
jgi:hypothetical protein